MKQTQTCEYEVISNSFWLTDFRPRPSHKVRMRECPPQCIIQTLNNLNLRGISAGEAFQSTNECYWFSAVAPSKSTPSNRNTRHRALSQNFTCSSNLVIKADTQASNFWEPIAIIRDKIAVRSHFRQPLTAILKLPTKASIWKLRGRKIILYCRELVLALHHQKRFFWTNFEFQLLQNYFRVTKAFPSINDWTF